MGRPCYLPIERIATDELPDQRCGRDLVVHIRLPDIEADTELDQYYTIFIKKTQQTAIKLPLAIP